MLKKGIIWLRQIQANKVANKCNPEKLQESAETWNFFYEMMICYKDSYFPLRWFMPWKLKNGA
jgi:hypothetical protein